MSLDSKFEKAAEEAQSLTKRPDNEALLKLYSLYKQGSEGEVSGKRPGVLNVLARAKFDAWAGLKGTPKEDAKAQYISFVNDLKSAEI